MSEEFIKNYNNAMAGFIETNANMKPTFIRVFRRYIADKDCLSFESIEEFEQYDFGPYIYFTIDTRVLRCRYEGASITINAYDTIKSFEADNSTHDGCKWHRDRPCYTKEKLVAYFAKHEKSIMKELTAIMCQK